MNSEIIELKKEVLELKSIINTFILPSKLSITFIANSLGVSRQAIYKHIISNFKEKEHFYKENGKILVDVSVLPIIKAHYEK